MGLGPFRARKRARLAGIIHQSLDKRDIYKAESGASIQVIKKLFYHLEKIELSKTSPRQNQTSNGIPDHSSLGTLQTLVRGPWGLLGWRQ